MVFGGFVVKIGDETCGKTYGETCEIQDDQNFSGDWATLLAKYISSIIRIIKAALLFDRGFQGFSFRF